MTDAEIREMAADIARLRKEAAASVKNVRVALILIGIAAVCNAISLVVTVLGLR